MRARAVRLSGEIVGRGIPGAFWSPDLVLRDDTGMLFVLYRQSIPFARFLFALNADEYIGQRVTIEGWYRRGLRPYVEMSSLATQDGKMSRAWSRWVQYLLAAGAMAAGYLWLTL
jgi:heat shock protein HtpX